MTTLYLTEPYSTVRKDGDTLLVKIPANKALGTAARDVRVPLIKIEQVVVLADSTLTTPALLALLEQKVDIRVIQVLLGHKKLDTTALYVQVATDLLREVVSPLDTLEPLPLD